MSFQPTVAHHIPVGAPAAYWYPVSNSSAPRVGWFADDGTCHGELVLGSHTNVFGGDLHASDDGLSECTQFDSEEDAVTPELPVGSPESSTLREASPPLATLKDKSNFITVPAAVNEAQAPESDKDVRQQTNCHLAAASQQGVKENAPSASSAGLKSVADVLAAWGRLRTATVSPSAVPQAPTPGMNEQSQSPAGDAVDVVEWDDAVDGNETRETKEVEGEDDGPYHIIVKPHAHRYLGYAKRW